MIDQLGLFSFAPHKKTMSNGRDVYLRRLSGAERIAWLEQATNKDSQPIDDTAALLALSLVDSAGTRYFKGDELDAVKNLDHVLMEELAAEAMDLNLFSKKSREDAEKKSEIPPITSNS